MVRQSTVALNSESEAVLKISTQQITAFTHAARSKSFSKAALALGVTQSAITQHVANLERHMGAQLFVRRRDGLELTKPAQELFTLSDRMCSMEQQVAEKVEAYNSLASGHLRIIANAPCPSLPLIARYGELYPGVTVSFTLCSWTSAMAMLKSREIDVAVVTEPERVDGLFTMELERTRYMAFMPACHRLAKKREISLKDLAEEPLAVAEDGSLTQRLVMERCERHGVSLNRIIKMTTFPVIKEAVLHGIGIGIMLENSFCPSPQMIARPIKEIGDTLRNCLVTPVDKSNLKFVRSFIDIAEAAT